MKKIIVLSLILLITISMVINVYATSTFEMSLQSSKNEVSKGEEFTVDVKLSNIQMDKGLIALGGKIEYDRDSLELVKLEGESKWARPSYNEDNGKFATDRDDYGTTDEVMFKIFFKVKEQSKENLTITVSDIAASNGKDEVRLDAIRTNVKVKNGSPNTPDDKPSTNTSVNNTTTNNNTTAVNNTSSNNTTNNNGNNGNNNSNNNNNNNNNNNSSNKPNSNASNNSTNIEVTTNTSDNIKDGVLPKAGSNAIVFGIIGILVIIAIILYVRIRIINSKATKNNIIK